MSKKVFSNELNKIFGTKDIQALDDLYSDYRLTLKEVMTVLSSLADRRDVVVRKLDGVRKMKGAIDDEMYEHLIEEYHSELDTIHCITLTLK